VGASQRNKCRTQSKIIVVVLPCYSEELSMRAMRDFMKSVMIGLISMFISVILCSSILNTVRVGISAPLMFVAMGGTPLGNHAGTSLGCCA
tara:strand:+ start:123 stop:395 length:273 start_codon:yes stop_codon:yes gene_type:complete